MISTSMVHSFMKFWCLNSDLLISKVVVFWGIMCVPYVCPFSKHFDFLSAIFILTVAFCCYEGTAGLGNCKWICSILIVESNF